MAAGRAQGGQAMEVEGGLPLEVAEWQPNAPKGGLPLEVEAAEAGER